MRDPWEDKCWSSGALAPFAGCGILFAELFGKGTDRLFFPIISPSKNFIRIYPASRGNDSTAYETDHLRREDGGIDIPPRSRRAAPTARTREGPEHAFREFSGTTKDFPHEEPSRRYDSI